MARVLNFSAGPSQLPEPVLKKAAAELLDYGASGQSVMEMSHRSPVFESIIAEAEALLRELLGVPDGYHVLFLQGGGSTQFAMAPLNLMRSSMRADYVNTGIWTKKAIPEARKYGTVNVVASSESDNFCHIPELDPAKFDPQADYFYVCYNNTIFGTAYQAPPETGAVPLVADMSSCFMSGPVDVSRFGVIIAGAQKNLAPAGLTVVIIRDDLIGHALPCCPTMLNYKTHADSGSMYNTPPCWCIYMCKLVCEWLRDDIGGLEAMHEINLRKAALLYEYLGNSRYFKPTVREGSRSIMNIPFVTGDPAADKAFVAVAEAAGFVNLKGHRLVGGMRASIYNAMPVEGVQKLIDFMAKYEKENAR